LGKIERKKKESKYNQIQYYYYECQFSKGRAKKCGEELMAMGIDADTMDKVWGSIYATIGLPKKECQDNIHKLLINKIPSRYLDELFRIFFNKCNMRKDDAKALIIDVALSKSSVRELPSMYEELKGMGFEVKLAQRLLRNFCCLEVTTLAKLKEGSEKPEIKKLKGIEKAKALMIFFKDGKLPEVPKPEETKEEKKEDDADKSKKKDKDAEPEDGKKKKKGWFR